jgi:hypothetical protein
LDSIPSSGKNNCRQSTLHCYIQISPIQEGLIMAKEQGQINLMENFSHETEE